MTLSVRRLKAQISPKLTRNRNLSQYHKGEEGRITSKTEMQQKRHLNLESKNTWAISCDGELAGMIGDLKGTRPGD